MLSESLTPGCIHAKSTDKGSFTQVMRWSQALLEVIRVVECVNFGQDLIQCGQPLI